MGIYCHYRGLSAGLINLYDYSEYGINESFSRTKTMRAMPQVNTMSLKPRKAILLGTSALVCLALAAPVMATDFIITSGTTTNNGNIIDGAHTVTITGALVTTGTNVGIKTLTIIQKHKATL